MTTTLAFNELKKVNNEIKLGLRDMYNRKEINHSVKDYFLMRKTQLGRFYLLPRISQIHKRKHKRYIREHHCRWHQGLFATFKSNQ